MSIDEAIKIFRDWLNQNEIDGYKMREAIEAVLAELENR